LFMAYSLLSQELMTFNIIKNTPPHSSPHTQLSSITPVFYVYRFRYGVSASESG
jgi:hypothetical protein